ncbi:MAG: BlaI/MecI/CopY family transcriptional regulator [Pseudonocardiaceae bacterium]
MFGLGELESAVMQELWESEEPAKVRDILERLSTRKKLAYTTVMTVLDNLHRKGWARRELAGKAYLYEPALSREAAATRALREVLQASGNPELTLMHFARSASDEETAVLRDGLKRKTRRL